MEQLHEHNQRTYENICRMYGEGIQRVAVVQPTGSGKSLLMAKLIKDNPDSRFFVLSTSHKINDQFKSKLDEETLKRIDFNIYCNMPNMNDEIMKALQADYILLDEMHRALAKEWSKGINVLLEMYPNAKVLGLSATPIRYLDRCRNVVNELFGGNLACDMSLSQAILDGILPMARYVCGVYSFQKDAESLNKKIAKSSNSDEEKKELLEQVKVLKQNLDKANGVSEIIKKYVISGNEKFVVFLKDTTHLRDMKLVIEKWFTDAGFSVRMYEVHCKNVDKDKEFQAFKEDTEEGVIKACLSVNMLSEGLHGDIDGVIMLRETMSPNLYFQMIGRAFSCGKKTIPLIFDLVANSQFISDAVDNFPNELKGEIEKRKEECEKEGRDYEVGFNVDEFIIMDEFMDVVSGFRAIEGRLQGSWDLYIKALKQYKEREGDCDVPARHIEVVDGVKLALWNWCQTKRAANNPMRKGNLTKERKDQLDQIGFIWNVSDYRFKKYVFNCIKFYETNGRLPSISSEDLEERKLCRKIKTYKRQMSNYPQWKQDLLNKIPHFFDKKINMFDKFFDMVLIYKQRYGHVDIKNNDIIDGYHIRDAYSKLIHAFKNGKLTDSQVNRLKGIGIDITMWKDEKRFYENIGLVQQALSKGIVINLKNQTYKGINLYRWYLRNRNIFSEEELKIIEMCIKTIPYCKKEKPVRIIDMENNQSSTYLSISKAGQALSDEFYVVDGKNQGIAVITKRLKGKTKNSIYKGRFRFEYVNSEVN